MTMHNRRISIPAADEAHTTEPEVPTPCDAAQLPPAETLVIHSQDTPQATHAAAGRRSVAGDASTPTIHVNRATLEMVTGQRSEAVPVQDVQAARDLNMIVHRVLVIGLIASVTLLLVGLGLDFFLHREIPTIIPSPTEALRRALVLRPSGFLALGVIVLVATPIVRVVGSLLVFLYERDWRYVVVTGVVLIITIISIRIGAG
jgi:uncharacterized membrane protein